MIPLSLHSDAPLVRQVYTGLRNAVLSNTLRPGERLPSTRQLAADLGVSRTVVLLAYDQLRAEGFVAARAGSGTYVSGSLGGSRRAAPRPAARIRLSRFGTAAEAVASTVELPRRRTAGVRYDFAYGRTEIGTFPFPTWRRMLLRHARKAPARTLDYGPSGGSPALREAIAAHLRRSRAVICDAAQIIVVNGSQQALDLAARVLLERGDSVVIENPHYHGTREILRAAGAQLLPIPVDEAGLDPSTLPSQARMAVVTPSHQFPTGAVLPLARRLQLLDWARRANAVIIEDDYDGEFRYEGQPVESLQGLSGAERVIYVGTFSRTIFPALRIGYLVVPEILTRAFTTAKWLCDRHTATLEQETLAEFVGSGMYERYLRRTRREHALHREELLSALDRYLGQRVRVGGQAAGTHVVIWPTTRVNEEAVIAQAAGRGVGIYGISPYYIGRPVRAGFLLGYSRISGRDIREGVRRLGDTDI